MPRPRSCDTILATSRDLKLVGIIDDPTVHQADLELTCPSETCRQKSLISMIGNRYDGRAGDTMVALTSGAILTCLNASCSKSIGIINPLFDPTVKSSTIHRTLASSDIKEFEISDIGTKLSEDSARLYYRYRYIPKVIPDVVFLGRTRTSTNDGSTTSARVQDELRPHLKITQFALAPSTRSGTRDTVQTTWQPEGQSAEIDIVPTFLGYRNSPSQQEYDGVYTYRTDEGYETSPTLKDISIFGLPEKFTYN